MKKFDSAIAMNKLGVSHYKEGRYDEAVLAYQSAIDERPDFTDAYYNLGLALTKAGRRVEAMNAYDALLALSPQHLGGRFQIGCLWMQRDDYQKALSHFLEIECTCPQHMESLINLATCFFKLGYLNEAKSRYLKALEIEPKELQALFNLGVISMRQGRVREAIGYYLRAINVDAHFYDAHNNLAVAYLAINDIDAARLHFCAALRIQPQDEAIRHTINILSREKNISTSPIAYVRALFDSYAEHFDAHLTQGLRYEVPAHFMQMIKEAPGFGEANWSVLDLGCGTGLSGEVLRHCAHTMVGVDLSSKMLDIAKQKQLYDELIESDVLSMLRNRLEQFDLIVAGDVLVYFGDLAEIVAAVSGALKPKGLFLFNTEIDFSENYRMTDSGRFAHSQKYIDSLAIKNHLTLLQYNIATMRTQNEVPVQGHFYLLQKLC